jgi:hypothetical protein
MDTSTATVVGELKRMMSIFSINMSNPFNEINTNLIKLNIHLANIEGQCYPKTRDATAKELDEETKRVMEDIGHTFLKR